MKVYSLFLRTFLVLVSTLMVAHCGVLHKKVQVADLPTMSVTTQKMQEQKRATSIQVLYPSNYSTTTKSEIGLVARVDAGEPVRNITVSVNARQLKRFDISRKGEKFQRSIPIEVVSPLTLGQNKIALIVTTIQGEELQKIVEVNRVKPTKMAFSKSIGKRWAVAIGISQYLYARKGIRPLQYAHRDASEFIEFLHTPQGGSFHPTHTKLLINEEASTRNVRSALFTFLKQARKDDLVIIYFAGHGAPEPGRTDNLYLITYDTDPKDLASTAFPMWDMETALKRYIVAERVIVIADACHSAGVGGEIGLRAAGNANLINIYLENLQKTKPGRVIITASEANQLSREGSEWGGHGVFTYFLLRGLKGQADSDGSGVITIAEAFNYVYDKVRRATSSLQHPNIQGQFDPNFPLAVIR